MERFEKWPLLSQINSPEALRALPEKQLALLADEIRDYLVYRVGENGGHLSSNLGAVELTMALHRVFDSPKDHIIFDVGHQSYVHKLLTGRGERFDTLRCPGGLSGFTKREESAHDPFGAGHSSTAISAAIGMAEADALAGRDAWTVAVVGDGALTGGLAYEGLNNCRSELRLIVVINENEMSISPNTGRLADQLSRMRTSSSYIRTKELAAGFLRKIPLIGKPLYRLIRRIKRWFKHRFYRENVFEYMGIHYLGPIDGNDVSGVEAMLRHAKRLGSSVILHLKTVKGKGYAPAERDAGTYHSVPPCEREAPLHTFSRAMGDALCAEAAKNEKICAITAAMCGGTGLCEFAAHYPKRFFDVGIAEGHAVSFAARRAAGGQHPVVAVYATFLQRAVDNVLHDAALQGLPLTLCIDRAGLNGADGPTHHGVFDVAMLSMIPNVRIFAPVTFAGVARALHVALGTDGVCAVRYPAGGESAAIAAAFYPNGEAGRIGVRSFQNGESPVLTVVTHGRIAAEALAAAERLQKEGITLRVLLCEYIAPYTELAAEVVPLLAGDGVLLLEEEIRAGGFGMNLRDALLRAGVKIPALILAAESGFVTPTQGQTPLQAAGADAACIQNTVHRMVTEQKERELC